MGCPSRPVNMALTIGYGQIAALLMAATVIFSRRDFK